jgi:hypothetical protein
LIYSDTLRHCHNLLSWVWSDPAANGSPIGGQYHSVLARRRGQLRVLVCMEGRRAARRRRTTAGRGRDRARRVRIGAPGGCPGRTDPYVRRQCWGAHVFRAVYTPSVLGCPYPYIYIDAVNSQRIAPSSRVSSDFASLQASYLGFIKNMKRACARF